MPVALIIAEGKWRGKRFRFHAERVSIGRGADNDVVLNDAGVSRAHARIERRDCGWVLVDRGSANGTALNGATVVAVAPLRDGDRFSIGAVKFEFRSIGHRGAGTRGTVVQSRLATVRRWGLWAADRWTHLRPPARAGLIAACTLIAVAGSGTALRAGEARPKIPCPETVAIDDGTADLSFGHLDAEVDCGARAVFGFRVGQDARLAFRYRPLLVTAPNALELRLNGRHLAWAPVAPWPGELLSIPLARESLSTGGENFLAFTSAREDVSWSVGKVRLEAVPPPPGALPAARAALERGRRKLEERRIAPRNLYDACKAFTEARAHLEGVTEAPSLRGELAQLVRDCERDLERQCSRLLFSATRFERYDEEDKAQRVWREVLLHFPGEDATGCRKKAQENLVSAQPDDAGE
jgi:hypothetical protein